MKVIIRRRLHSVPIFILLFYFINCGQERNYEISTRKEIISCKYVGLTEQNGQPIVDLVFKNNTGKNLTNVFGGLRIINRDGEVIQRTGFTYSLLFHAGEEKKIPAFAYIQLSPEALEILSSENDFIPMIFELSDVVFEDGQSITF